MNIRNNLMIFFSAIRLHQWVKNALLFLPLLMAHKPLNADNGMLLFLGFFAFCFCASVVYLMNDCIDIEHDKLHPVKKNRVIASGKIRYSTVMWLCVLLMLCSVSIAMRLPKLFQVTLAAYFVSTVVYSLVLKKLFLADVFTLAFLYTIRIYAGSVLVCVPISPWLFSFSIYVFTSLALVKRVSGIQVAKENGKQVLSGRAYTLSDEAILTQIGISLGVLSSLVLSLYISVPKVVSLYRHQEVLWAIIPLFLYWIIRLWVFAVRGRLQEDPLLFSLKDVQSYFIVGSIGFLGWLAA